MAPEAFDLDGASYGGRTGPVTDAARRAALHCGGSAAGRTRLLSSQSVAALAAITIPGKPYDLGLGWVRPPATTPARTSSTSAAAWATGTSCG